MMVAIRAVEIRATAPVKETVSDFLASPAIDAQFEVPVVVVRFLPTNDGVNLDVTKAPDYWSLNPMPLRNSSVVLDMLIIKHLELVQI